MPMPKDPLNREWAELSGANTDLVNDFRPVLVSLLARNASRFPSLVGSGFFIAGSPNQFGLILTAKHVLQSGVLDIQSPHRRHAPSALQIFLPPQRPNIKRGKLAALWADSKHALALNFAFCCFNDSCDLACALVMPDEKEAQNFIPHATPLSTEFPRLGSLVQMVSFNSMRLKAGSPDRFMVGRNISVRIGTVTGLYPEGFRQYRWPCFTTTIPAEPGMSGGLVSIYRPNQTVAACGLICADNSTLESRADQMLAGESVIGMTYMALALRLPLKLSDDASQVTIQEAMRTGVVPPAHNGFNQFHFVED